MMTSWSSGKSRLSTSTSTCQAALPQHQVRGGVDAPLVEKQLAGFVVLAAETARIDAEVRVEAIFSRDARLHVRIEAFRARHLDGLVRRPGEDPGMPVENPADALAGTHLGHHQVHPLAVGFHARLAHLVV